MRQNQPREAHSDIDPAYGAGSGTGQRQERRALLALGFAGFGSSAMMRVCDPMLPALARDFDVTAGQASQTISAYAIAYGILQLIFGPLGDRYGKRRVVGIAALLCIVGNALAVFAGTLDLLIVARALAGVAAAGIIPLSLAWIGDTVPYAQRQAALARYLTAILMGLIAGQWVAGVITDLWGWRWIFALLFVFFLAVGLALSLDASVRREAARPPSGGGYVHDMVDVLTRPWAVWLLVAVTLEGAFAFSAMAFLPTFMHDEYGFGISVSSGIVALYGVGGMVYSFGARKLLSRFSEEGMAILGGLLLTASWLMVAVLDRWEWVPPATVAAGIGYYTLHSTLMTQATQMAPAARGTAMSLFAGCLFLGISIGVGSSGLVIDHVSYRWVFAVCALGLGLLAGAFAYSLRRRGRR
ncbi:MFS transporter [Parapusillimonas granuli]|uniref:MFS transporter n=1 Tax=Parapusillimonas granuli TaxID=380911 RepID=A0A853FW23_9BURK|nr:MFS transporter [Parapusillimonas granuli]MBB5214584.1 putative MFS family arabinose efflux permease [Parapusillimonas granuli]MEB2398167.1 MFS transporter [Alcaligenaceae bacterium]NYT49008.1 MFS transporter [Parapusillimonas granuli]